MRHSTSSATRVLTIISLVILCTLSFAVVYGTQNIVDTPPQDSLFSFHKPNVPHHRRALHHLRAESSDSSSSTPSSTPSPTSSDSTQSSSVKSKSTSSTPVSSPTSLTPVSPSSKSSTSSSESSSTPKPSDTTTSTTSTTSTSTSSSTPSSSSTTSSPSSNTSPTTATTSSITNLAIGGSTTRFISNSPLSTSSLLTPSGRTSTISATNTAGAASKGFFANKAAVGITFGIVGVICGLAAIVGVITVIRRYRRAHNDDDDFYEKYPGAGGAADHSHFSREPAELGQGPLGESATDLTTHPAPLDAYPDRAIHYGQPDPSTVFRPVDYGIDYPPNAAYADPAAAHGRGDIAYDHYDYDPTRPSSGSATGHPFADPANASRTVPAPPVTYPRQLHGRAQEVVATDSYYGPNTAGVGAVGVGFAQ